MNLRTYLMIKQAWHIDETERLTEDESDIEEIRKSQEEARKREEELKNKGNNKDFDPSDPIEYPSTEPPKPTDWEQVASDFYKRKEHNADEARRLAVKGRKLSERAGAIGGGVLGGSLGYLGSNWLSKKLKLQGPNVSRKRRIADILLRTGGTLGVAALGAGAGYAGGNYLGREAFYPNVLN